MSPGPSESTNSFCITLGLCTTSFWGAKMFSNLTVFAPHFPTVGVDMTRWNMFMQMHHSHIPYIHSTTAFWMHLFLVNGPEHLTASWMGLDPFGRIIENLHILEQHSLVVSNARASFGLWIWFVSLVEIPTNNCKCIHSEWPELIYIRFQGLVSWIVNVINCV